jgi:hypothetical protein
MHGRIPKNISKNAASIALRKKKKKEDESPKDVKRAS